MTLSLKTYLPRCIIVSSFVFLAIVTSISRPLQAEQPALPPGAWHSNQATLLAGLSEVKAKTKGYLSLTPSALLFTTPAGSTSVPRDEILTVTTGDVRVETGGTTGKITRALIPFGGGAVVATVTNKQVDLLTIEFRDEHNALHGAVFLLPKDEGG